MKLYVLHSFVFYSDEPFLEGVFDSMELLEKAQIEISTNNEDVDDFDITEVELNTITKE